MYPTDCDDCCFGFLCLTCGYACCCRKMQRSTRIKILWAWLIVLSTASSVFIGCVVFAPTNQKASPSDMLPIKDNVDFLFCEKVAVSSTGYHFNAYVETGDLIISADKREPFSQTTSLLVDREAYSIIPFYFLPTTYLFIRHSVPEPIIVYVIAGVKNLQKWKNYRTCDNCYVSKHYLFPNDSGPGSQWEQSNDIRLSITKEDNYFIVYSNDNIDETWVRLNLSLDRSVYDLNNSAVYCTGQTMCDIDLKNPKDHAVIWITPSQINSNLADAADNNITVKCVPRIWAYLLLHGIPVLFIGICGSILMQKMCRDADDDDLSERSSLLGSSRSGSALPPTYSSVILHPPKYEDIVRDEGLPSYSEAVAGIRQASVNSPRYNQVQPDAHNQYQPNSPYLNTGHLSADSDGQIVSGDRNSNETRLFVESTEQSNSCSQIETDDQPQAPERYRSSSCNAGSLQSSSLPNSLLSEWALSSSVNSEPSSYCQTSNSSLNSSFQSVKHSSPSTCSKGRGSV